nr:elongation factor P [Corynebacterium diphtheriae]
MATDSIKSFHRKKEVFSVATTADFKNGLVLKIDNKLQQIIEFQHVKPGKGPAFVRTKLKDVVSGKVTDKTFNAGVKVETATVDRRDMTYLYNDGSSYVVMDEKTFEQAELAPHIFGDAARFLLENTTVQVSFHEGEPLFAELPISLDLRIEHTDPGLQGDRSTGGTKPATLETGAEIQVPLFIETGNVVKVDTRDGSYLSRVNN